jgi:cation diffusion facilitator CzcD-associated flavoprotein CzcO
MRAEWNDGDGKWHVTIRRSKVSSAEGNNTADEEVYWNWEAEEGYEEFEDTADVLFSAMGGLSRWSWPDIKNLDSFKGKVYHSAQWDDQGKGWQETVKDWKDKKVGVIGVVRLTETLEMLLPSR